MTNFGASFHEQGHYGALPIKPLAEWHGPAPGQTTGAAKHGKARPKQPRTSNLAGVCFALFLPWFLFCLMYAVMSFSMHYKEKSLCFMCVLMGFVFAAAVAKLAVDKQRSDTGGDASWFVFLAAACFIAWLAGVLLGDLNYFYNMEPYYDVKNLNVYPDVDPAQMSGQQVMDAGRMTFVPGTRLDLDRSMAFKNLDVYCVVPIVNSNNNDTKKSFSYDFWAVGLNCCSGRPGDFSCGEYNNPHAAAGLRVMRDDQRDFYRLAVQQAEATYNIRAKHPLFLYWMQDPISEISAYMDEGYKYYLFGVFSCFAFLLFLVIIATVLFSKMA